MKTLNLDSLSKSKRTLTLNGEQYEVEEMTVENFIETTKEAAALEANDKSTFADQLEAAIAMIQRSVPSCPAKSLRKLSIEQLVTISKFLRGEMDDEVAESADAEGGEKK